MSLGELRRWLPVPVSQSDVGMRLGMSTAQVALLESRDVSQLGAGELINYVEALGGRVEAVVPTSLGDRRTRL